MIYNIKNKTPIITQYIATNCQMFYILFYFIYVKNKF